MYLMIRVANYFLIVHPSKKIIYVEHYKVYPKIKVVSLFLVSVPKLALRRKVKGDVAKCGITS